MINLLIDSGTVKKKKRKEGRKKRKKPTSELLPNQFPRFANILTTVNLLQWCHLQNFPISRKPVPPSPIITGASLQISCGQTACDVLAKICALWVLAGVRSFFSPLHELAQALRLCL